MIVTLNNNLFDNDLTFCAESFGVYLMTLMISEES